jgi:hypothetical protein
LKRLTAIGLLSAGLLIMAAPAATAGGWAITSMDELPGEFQAGETYQLGYTILQHGKTPVDGAETDITARNPATGETLRFVGQADGQPGHYVAEVTFPEGGSWTWSVTQGDFAVHELGDLLVAAAPVEAVAATVTASLPVWGLVLAVATAIALGVFATQLVRVIRRRSAKLGLAD